MNLSLENRLILYGSRLNLSESKPESAEFEKLLNQPLNWEEVLEKARVYAVAPLLYRNLKPYESKLPKDIFQALQSLYYANMLRNDLTFKRLEKLIQAFNEEKVELILLKGAALATEVYKDPALRIMVDVDLLVKVEKLYQAEAKLCELGYLPCGSRAWARPPFLRFIASSPHPSFKFKGWHHLTPYISPDKNTMVEIHADIIPTFSKCRLDLNKLWLRAKPIQISGISRVETLTLSPEDLILHLGLHLALNHQFDANLIQVCDISETIQFYENIDWGYITETATSSGASQALYYALLTSKKLLQTDIPDQILKQLSKDEKDEKVIEIICESILSKEKEAKISSEMPRMFQELLTSEKISDLARILIKSLSPSRQFMRATYSLPSNSNLVYLYYLIRPFDLALRLIKIGVIFASKPKSFISFFKRKKIIRRALLL